MSPEVNGSDLGQPWCPESGAHVAGSEAPMFHPKVRATNGGSETGMACHLPSSNPQLNRMRTEAGSRWIQDVHSVIW